MNVFSNDFYNTVDSVESTLKSVELNVIEICNRSCSFCPRSDIELYPNSKYHMSLDTVKSIGSDLQEINYSGRISFAGFGEPLLYKNLPEAIKILKDKIHNVKLIEITTNGDFLTKEKIEELAIAGCHRLTVSMYDRDISKEINALSKNIDIQIAFKHCYEQRFELNLVNRVDIFKKENVLSRNARCNLPCYKMLIDYNGDVLICANDWDRQGIVGNVHAESIKNIWLGSTLTKYRKNLIDGFRGNLNPCKFCNIIGTIQGNESAEFFKSKYSSE